MKKSAFVLIMALLCMSFSGCSSDKAQNNLSKAVDDAGNAWDRGVNDVANGIDRGWDNGTNTNGTGTGYYSDNYSGYGNYGGGYYTDGYNGTMYDNGQYSGVSGTRYGDDSG